MITTSIDRNAKSLWAFATTETGDVDCGLSASTYQIFQVFVSFAGGNGEIIKEAVIMENEEALLNCEQVRFCNLSVRVGLFLATYLSSYHVKAIKALKRARLGVASHLSTTPR